MKALAWNNESVWARLVLGDVGWESILAGNAPVQ